MITLFFSKTEIDDIIRQSEFEMSRIKVQKDLNIKDKLNYNGYEIEFKDGSFTIARNIIFDLYYWNISKECYKTNMDLKIRIDLIRKENRYIKCFQCFINNEKVELVKGKPFPPKILQYEAIRD